MKALWKYHGKIVEFCHRGKVGTLDLVELLCHDYVVIFGKIMNGACLPWALNLLFSVLTHPRTGLTKPELKLPLGSLANLHFTRNYSYKPRHTHKSVRLLSS